LPQYDGGISVKPKSPKLAKRPEPSAFAKIAERKFLLDGLRLCPMQSNALTARRIKRNWFAAATEVSEGH
jgi:hypothetical protein